MLKPIKIFSRHNLPIINIFTTKLRSWKGHQGGLETSIHNLSHCPKSIRWLALCRKTIRGLPSPWMDLDERQQTKVKFKRVWKLVGSFWPLLLCTHFFYTDGQPTFLITGSLPLVNIAYLSVKEEKHLKKNLNWSIMTGELRGTSYGSVSPGREFALIFCPYFKKFGNLLWPNQKSNHCFHWIGSVYKSQCPSGMCRLCHFFCVICKCLTTPIYKC